MVRGNRLDRGERVRNVAAHELAELIATVEAYGRLVERYALTGDEEAHARYRRLWDSVRVQVVEMSAGVDPALVQEMLSVAVSRADVLMLDS